MQNHGGLQTALHVAVRRNAKNIFKRHPTDENLRKLRMAENDAKRVI
jgi:hypothetical protein